jgi:hypothetical protein
MPERWRNSGRLNREMTRHVEVEHGKSWSREAEEVK